jgi:hypothetical protein
MLRFYIFQHHKALILFLRYPSEMTPQENPSENEKVLQTLEEICENTRAIRRVVNRILDHLHESVQEDDDCDLDSLDWEELDNRDDMYY